MGRGRQLRPQLGATAPHRIERMIGGGLCIIGVGAWLALSHGIA